MNIFERAARCGLEFQTRNGSVLKAEDLFKLPLETSGNKLSLDIIAQDIHKELESLGAVSFVATKSNPRKEKLELQFEIVKHIIASKLADAAAAETRVQNDQLRRKLDDAIEAKESEGLKTKSLDELKAERAKLGS